MNKKLLKWIIFLLIFVIILIIVILFYLNTNPKKDIVLEENEQEEGKETIKIQEIANVKEVYRLEEEINTYFDNIEIAATESSYVSGINKEKEIMEKLKVDTTREVDLLKAYEVKVNNKNTLYFLEGDYIPKNLQNNEKELKEKQKVYYTITVDNENGTFDVMPYAEEYKDAIKYSENIIENIIDVNELKKISKTIVKLYYNEIIDKEVSDEDIANYYYDNYKKNALYYTEDAYKRLEERYKEARFPIYETYKQYVQEQKSMIEGAILSKYSVDEIDGNTVYTLVDNYQNSYFIIIQTSPMDYKIQLDNYTIKVPTYEEKYLKMSEEDKVSANAHIFIQMINTKDYESAYKLLDEGFKSNYFKTVEDFEMYIRNNWFSYNIESAASIQKEGNNFIYQVKLRNSSASWAEQKNVTIIMKLKEGTDFVMSFSIE